MRSSSLAEPTHRSWHARAYRWSKHIPANRPAAPTNRCDYWFNAAVFPVLYAIAVVLRPVLYVAFGLVCIAVSATVIGIPAAAIIGFGAACLLIGRPAIGFLYGFGKPQSRTWYDIMFEDYDDFEGIALGRRRIHHQWLTITVTTAALVLAGFHLHHPYAPAGGIATAALLLTARFGYWLYRNWHTSKAIHAMKVAARNVKNAVCPQVKVD